MFNSSLFVLLALQSSYDSVSSYESYQQRLGLGPNAHDDLKSCNGSGSGGGGTGSQRGHDPYRFTRSTQQPLNKALDSPMKQQSSDYPKYRYVVFLINLH